MPFLRGVTIRTQPSDGIDLTASTKDTIMRTALPTHAPSARSHRPRALTVFVAAFVAGAAAAVGVNRTLDVRLAQSKPRVESESIFVALRSLPQGSPVTVWDVALRDWPKAMLPATALRASDTFSGQVLKHPLREGQPLLSIQLSPAAQGTPPTTEPTPFPPPAAYTRAAAPAADADLWSTPVTLPPQQVARDANVPLPNSNPNSNPNPNPNPVPVPVPDTPPQQAIVTPSEPTPVEDVASVSEPVTAGEIAPASQPSASEPVSPQETVATEAVLEAIPEAIAAIADQPITDSNSPTAREGNLISEPTQEPVTAATAPETVATATPRVEAEPTPEPSTVSEQQPPAQSIGDVSINGVQPLTTAVIAAPAVSLEAVQPVPPPIAALAPIPDPTSTPVPAARPRPAQTRFLVVPERIAVQADASFASPSAPRQPVATALPTAARPAGRPTPEAVQPLPSITTVERRQQERPTGNNPQGRQPQRQGRQSRPAATTGGAAGTTPQPRLGMAMFPNVSAGIEAIEGRMRGDLPAQEGSATAAPTAAR